MLRLALLLFLGALVSAEYKRYVVILKDHVGPQQAHNHVVDHTIHFMESDNEHPYHTLATPELFSLPEKDGTPMVWYTAHLDEACVDMMKENEDVEDVVEDTTFKIATILDGPPPGTRDTVQWGLTRVSHRGRMSDAGLTFDFQENDGEGVNVYVIDTGVNIHHPEFEDRAHYGKSFVKRALLAAHERVAEDQRIMGDKNPPEDYMGHGTHVSSSVAGKTYGVAPKADIIAVRVLDENGSGSLADVIAGIEWVVRQHLKQGRQSKNIINMSLGAWKSDTVNRAVNAAVSAGIHVIVAAGNENDDSCFYSPSSASDVVSVGATTKTDARAYFSNYGDCVAVYAPGHEIEGAWLGNENKTISGTSMASPHVAGVVAAMLSRGDYIEPLKMRDILSNASTHHILTGLPGDGAQGIVFTCPNSYDGSACPNDDTQPPNDGNEGDDEDENFYESFMDLDDESFVMSMFQVFADAINSFSFWFGAFNN